MQSSCRLYSVPLLLQRDRLPIEGDTWSRWLSAVIELPLSAFRWQRSCIWRITKDFIPKHLSKTCSNCTCMKHILLACSGARVGVLANKELRCTARMGRVTHWKARRLHFPLNICNVIKSWEVRRKMENACTNLVCSHYHGRPICSLRIVLQLLVRQNSDHVHLKDFIALRDFNSAAYHHHFLKFMWYIDISLGQWSKRRHTVGLPTGEDHHPYN